MDMQRLKKLVTLQEGYRAFPYDDATGNVVKAPVGNLTIGIGRNLQSNGLSMTEIDFMLENDLNYHYTKLSHALDFFDKLDDVRKAVLIDISFNLGFHGIMEFHDMLNLISECKYDLAAEDLLQSKAAHQLPKRYQDNAEMLKTGEWMHV